jgi:hypothetical protein
MLGKDMTTATSQYFTTPTAETTSDICHSASSVFVLGAPASPGQIAYVTGLTLSVKKNAAPDPAAGASTYQAINPGRILVDGQLTAYFPDATLRDYFLNETQCALMGAFANGAGAAADFVGFTVPLLKFTGADKDDGDKSLIRTLPFMGTYNAGGGSGQQQEQTSLYIQDSLA